MCLRAFSLPRLPPGVHTIISQCAGAETYIYDTETSKVFQLRALLSVALFVVADGVRGGENY